MRRTRWLALALAWRDSRRYWYCPAAAFADATLEPADERRAPRQTVGINSLWVVVAGILVMFMQAGFAFLEIGFSRGKNAGTVVAKILGELLDRGAHVLGGRLRLRVRRAGNAIIGTHGFFLRDSATRSKASR